MDSSQPTTPGTGTAPAAPSQRRPRASALERAGRAARRLLDEHHPPVGEGGAVVAGLMLGAGEPQFAHPGAGPAGPAAGRSPPGWARSPAGGLRAQELGEPPGQPLGGGMDQLERAARTRRARRRRGRARRRRRDRRRPGRGRTSAAAASGRPRRSRAPSGAGRRGCSRPSRAAGRTGPARRPRSGGPGARTRRSRAGRAPTAACPCICSPTCQSPVPALSTVTAPARPARASSSRSITSAMGERQMFPRQTRQTR